MWTIWDKSKKNSNQNRIISYKEMQSKIPSVKCRSKSSQASVCQDDSASDVIHVAGNGSSATQIATLHGNVESGRIFSSTGASLYLHFVSDYSIVSKGFELAYSYIPTGMLIGNLIGVHPRVYLFFGKLIYIQLYVYLCSFSIIYTIWFNKI